MLLAIVRIIAESISHSDNKKGQWTNKKAVGAMPPNSAVNREFTVHYCLRPSQCIIISENTELSCSNYCVFNRNFVSV